MAEHSPTPWRNIRGRIISDVMPRDGTHEICGVTIINNDYVTAQANAELIVKAVNNHEALVKACEAAEEWLSGWASADPYLTVIRNALAGVRADVSSPTEPDNSTPRKA